EFAHQRRGRNLPGQGMFAAAGTEQKDVHATPPVEEGWRPVGRTSLPAPASAESSVPILPSRSGDDLLKRRDMAGERATPNCSGSHGGLRFFSDKRLFDGDIPGSRQRLDVGAEIAVSGPGQLFKAG